MSRIIGDCLIAGGPNSPEAEARATAVHEILTCFYLYPNYRVDSRDVESCLYRALEALRPEVARTLAEDGATAAWKRFGAEEEEQ